MMTLDEAIKHCEEVAGDAEKGYRYHANRGRNKDLWLMGLYKNRAEEHRQLAEWLKELKAYREQQPCEDCISRQAVDDYLVEALSGYLTDEERTRLEDITTYLWELPSVTPANVYVKGYKDAMAVHEKLKVEHKGKWIVWTDDRKDYAKCSCCGYGEEGEVLWKDTTRFCPNCGADMRGEEE